MPERKTGNTVKGSRLKSAPRRPHSRAAAK
jgi:hypothetical protein